MLILPVFLEVALQFLDDAPYGQMVLENQCNPDGACNVADHDSDVLHAHGFTLLSDFRFFSLLLASTVMWSPTAEASAKNPSRYRFPVASPIRPEPSTVMRTMLRTTACVLLLTASPPLLVCLRITIVMLPVNYNKAYQKGIPRLRSRTPFARDDRKHICNHTSPSTARSTTKRTRIGQDTRQNPD